MRHWVVGAGGVGGLVAGVLARAGEDVTLLVRPGTAATYPPVLRVESAVAGTFEVPVAVADVAPGGEADVLWLTVKATQLEAVLATPPGARCVIPLLNGVDHVARLRGIYGEAVMPGVIRVESERRAPGVIAQPGPFISADLAPPPALAPVAEAVRALLEGGGVACSVQADEVAMLWRKLAFLAPGALATSSARGAMGDVRRDPELRPLMLACVREVCAVATAEGAPLDGDAAVQAMEAMPDTMVTSMSRDIAAGNPPELDAIAGPVLRAGERHGLPTPATAELSGRVRRLYDHA